MNISVIGGTGYVGLTAAACLAYKGHMVCCVDIDPEKVQLANQGLSAFYENDLEKILKHVASERRLMATLDYKGPIKDSSIVFLCAGTPSRKDGDIDLSQVREATRSIARALKTKKDYFVLVIKSTVMPGTTESVIIPLLERISGKRAGKDFGVCVNPEFLREGSAVKDFLFPKEQGIVIGELDEKSGDWLSKLYQGFDAGIFRTTINTAEMIKYARNAYLAKDISFANEIANICQRCNIDFLEVKKGLEMDSRIGKGRFINAGIGFGGSCFPKDVRALARKAEKVGIKPRILRATLEINDYQPKTFLSLVRQTIGNLKGVKVAVLGLAFKSGTDDLRESRSIPIVLGLLAEGAVLHVFDSKAGGRAKSIFGNKVHYSGTAKEALISADACIITTESAEFADPKLYDHMRGNFIFDGRRVLNCKRLNRRFIYAAIGFPAGDKI